MLKQTLREHLRQTCSDTELKQWFDPLRLSLSDNGRKLHVAFPHSFFADWFAGNAQDKFEGELSRFLGPGYMLSYGSPGNNGTGRAHAPFMPKNLDHPFGRSFTFDNYLVNKKNYFPFISAKEVAKQSHVQYNPFIVCGAPGTGKTHLLKAIANELSKKYDRQLIHLTDVEALKSVFTEAGGDIFRARKKLYKHHFLLIDDFQTVMGDQELQDELIVLFNYFYDNKRQMVFCCADKVTSYKLEPKLKSRLEWGLIVNLKEPDLDIRVKYVQHQCRQKRLHLKKEHVLTLAQRFTDFRYLQGIFLKLTAFRELVKGDISDRDFKQILSHTEDRPTASLTPETVIATVAAHFGFPEAELKGAKRHHKVVLARQVAMHLCRELLGCSYPVLGRLFGGKDHSTAMYAVKKVEQLQKDNKDVKQLVTELKKQCLEQGAE